MSNISFKGIFIGGVIDVLATTVLSLPVTFYVMAKLHAKHVPEAQLQSAAMSAIYHNPLLFGVQALIGIGCSILGGYVAARIAKKNGSLNGVLSAWLCVGGGIYSLYSGMGAEPIGLTLAGFVISPIAGYVGGYLSQKGKKLRVSEA